MANYIFVAKGRARSGTRRITGREVLQARFDKKIWPLGEATRHQTKLRAGDRVLFYVAGQSDKDSGCVIGQGTIAGPRQTWRTSQEQASEWLGTVFPTRFHVPLGRAEFLKKPVSLRLLVDDLSFVKKPKWWGRYLQGGITPLADEDYALIVSN